MQSFFCIEEKLCTQENNSSHYLVSNIIFSLVKGRIGKIPNIPILMSRTCQNLNAFITEKQLLRAHSFTSLMADQDINKISSFGRWLNDGTFP